MQYFRFSLFALFAIFISIRDLQTHLIKNRTVILFAICGSFVAYPLRPIWFVYTTVITLLLHVMARGKIGAGDLKLFWILLIWSKGFDSWLNSFMVSWILGGLFSIGLWLLRSERKSNIPFAPFIFIGFISAI